MGLDLVEFTIAVEDAFQLPISDRDAADIRTPGQLVDYLLGRLTPARAPDCLDQRAFYTLRRAGMRVLDQPRSAFHPDTRWDNIILVGKRRQYWHLLHHTTAMSKWPRLTLWGSFPKHISTVGGTARYVATHTPGALKGREPRWTRSEIELVVTRLMADELGITDFRWEQRFVQDLGLD